MLTIALLIFITSCNNDPKTKSVKPSEREIAEFCVLTMFEPHKVYEKHFHTLKQRFNDEEIVQAAAYVSMLIAKCIGDKLYSNVAK